MPPCRALVENVGEIYIIFFVCHKMLIGFSVLAVITGVFIQETFKVANNDDRIMLMQKNRAIRMHIRKMDQLFKHLDQDEDGALTLEEFRHVMHDPVVKTWLASM